MMKRILLLGLVVFGLIAACTSGSVSSPANYTNLTAAQLGDMLENKDFLFVNVHIPYDGEIEKTDLFIPFDKIGGNLTPFPDKQAKIVLYCRSGAMSATAANTLADLGYSAVFNLDGGMRAWQDSGRQIIKKQQ